MSTFKAAGDINIPDKFFNRITAPTHPIFAELFGDGLLPGSVLTLSAKHGTGKTQLALSLLECLSSNYQVGYLSNEESVEQLAFTCKRINTFNVPIANGDLVSDVVEACKHLNVLVVDSFSKLRVHGVNGALKTEKLALDQIIDAAKQSDCCVILITHNTKAGTSKGTTQVQHDVDATMYIERVDDTSLRRVWTDKNRFGSPAEVFLEMTSQGLNLEPQQPPQPSEAAPKISKAQQRYQAVVELIQQEGLCSAASIASNLNIDLWSTNNILRELKQLGRVNKIGRGADAHFSIPAEV